MELMKKLLIEKPHGLPEKIYFSMDILLSSLSSILAITSATKAEDFVYPLLAHNLIEMMQVF